MKTAQVMAARLRLGCKLDKRDIDEAAAMLIQQAEQIEALKADAERYRYLRKHVLFGYCSAEGCNSDDVYLTVTGYKDFPKSGETVDMAIDAMKGKS